MEDLKYYSVVTPTDGRIGRPTPPSLMGWIKFPLSEFQMPVKKRGYRTPSNSKAKKRCFVVGRKVCCTYLPYPKPLLIQYSTIKIPHLWLLPQKEKRRVELSCNILAFQGTFQGTGFCFTWLEGSSTCWMSRGRMRTKVSLLAWYSSRKIILTETDSRGTSKSMAYKTKTVIWKTGISGEFLSRKRQTSSDKRLYTQPRRKCISRKGLRGSQSISWTE